MSDPFFVASVTTFALVGALGLVSIFVVIWRLTTSWQIAIGLVVVLVVALVLSLDTPLLLQLF